MILHDFLRAAVALLATSTVVVLLCHRLRVPPIIGFLLSGVLIGPSGLGWISGQEEVAAFAEIGVVFLLFSIGLEFSLDRLAQIRRAFFAGGALQSLLSIALGAGLAMSLGFAGRTALFLGFLLVLSSTAVVLRLYAERRELDAPQGKLILGVLLFQDFLLVPMIVLTPVLAGATQASPGAIVGRFVLSLAAVAAVFVVARYGMPRVLHLIVRSGVREILVLGSLFVCLGMAWLTESLDFSLALGAFLAGIIISESEYSHQVVAEITPLRDVFNSVFFLSIGMLLDLKFALANPAPILGLAAAIVLLKALAAGGAAAILRYPVRIVMVAGLGLAQVGEFSFVLLEVGRGHGLLDPRLQQLLIAAAVLTLLATPPLIALAPALAHRLPGRRPREETGAPDEGPRDHVLIVGFGHSGQTLARVLRAAAIRYQVVELGAEVARRARRAGEPVLFGDATRREILEHAGIARAKLVVFAISDFQAVARSVRYARDLNAAVHIVVRTRAVAEIAALRKAGADEVVAEEFETAIEIFTRVLERFHVPRNIVRAEVEALRGADYSLLRGPSSPAVLPAELERILAAGTTDVFRLAGGPAPGKTLRELGLREKTGATVVALVRGGVSLPSPAPDLRLEPDDDLVLVGSHQEIDAAFRFLEGTGSAPV